MTTYPTPGAGGSQRAKIATARELARLLAAGKAQMDAQRRAK